MDDEARERVEELYVFRAQVAYLTGYYRILAQRGDNPELAELVRQLERARAGERVAPV